MKFFYSASVMGYGFGRWWHKYYKFPNFDRVTKTLTIKPKNGYPFLVFKYKNSIWNKVSLHNIGIYNWIKNFSKKDTSKIILSISGNNDEVNEMIYLLKDYKIKGIELNISCPNIKNYEIKDIIQTNHKIYLKINHNYNMDSCKFIDKVEEVRLNSISKFFGGVSGKYAQKYNWPKIQYLLNNGINVAGCSCLNYDDIKRMGDYGCKSIGIGSSILINPSFVQSIK